MNLLRKNGPGISLCLAIAVPSWFLGDVFPIIGGAVIAILAGMLAALFFKDKASYEPGIKIVSKKVLQWAVILLGFGMDLNIVLQTGKQSLPIIICTISISLLIAYILHKAMKIPTKTSALIGVGSSICGGSAIAATAPVIEADEEEVTAATSVEQQVTAEYPPVCLWWGEADAAVDPANSRMLLAALEAAGVRCEHASYPGVGHGVGLGEGLACAGWPRRAVDFWRSVIG